MSTTYSDPFWYNDLSILINSHRLTEFFPDNKLSLDENLNAITRMGLYVSILLMLYTKNIRWINLFIIILLFTYYLYSNKSNEQSNGNTNEQSNGNVLMKIPNNNLAEPYNKQESLTKINKIEKFESNIDSEILDSELINSQLASVNDNIYANWNDTVDIKSDKKNTTCTEPTIDNPFMNMTMKDYLNTDNKGDIIIRPEACSTYDSNIKKEIDNKFKNNLYKNVNDVFGKFNSQRQYYTMPSTDIIPDINGEFKNWLYKSPKTCKENQDYCLKYEDVRAKRPIN